MNINNIFSFIIDHKKIPKKVINQIKDFIFNLQCGVLNDELSIEISDGSYYKILKYIENMVNVINSSDYALNTGDIILFFDDVIEEENDYNIKNALIQLNFLLGSIYTQKHNVCQYKEKILEKYTYVKYFN